MDSTILLGKNSAEEIGAAILKSFTNADDIVKSEAQAKLEKAISEGSLKVVSTTDIEKNYGGIFYTPEAVAKFKNNLDATIQKGETDFLEAEEFVELEKAQADYDSLEEVIVKGEVDGKEAILGRVFVQRHAPAVEDSKEEEADETED